jgi:5-methylcytosine-specific restriction endonuclease McrA
MRDREKVLTKDRRYRARNRERLNAKTRARYHANQEKEATRRKRKPQRTTEQRRAERMRMKARQGKPYVSIEERKAKAEERRLAKAARPPRGPSPQSIYLDLYLADHPQDVALPKSTLIYRARYAHDPVFKAKEIARTHRRKAVAGWVEDGTLTGRVIQALFAQAKRCPDCGKPLHPRDKSLDHIVPKSKGGQHSILNVRILCKCCNTKKGRTIPSQLTLVVAI